MSRRTLYQQLVADLQGTAQTVTELLEKGAFTELAEVFWQEDAAAFPSILDRFGLLRRCRWVCHYLCSKRCSLECLHLCGPLEPREPKIEELFELTEVIARIAEDDRILVPLVGAIEKDDARTFKEVVEKHDLHRFCHELCYWICSIRCGLHCHRVCEPPVVALPELVAEVRTASQAVARLAGQPDLTKALLDAHNEVESKRVHEILEGLGIFEHCHLICHFLCVWQCRWVCRQLCIQFPIEPVNEPLVEVEEFAKVTALLGQKPEVLEKLAVAVERRDVDTFTELVAKLRLERYCHQICGWICGFRCRLLCRLVCPPPCEILEPEGCVEEEILAELGIFRGIEIRGTATGASCDHYTLEWREAGTAAWRSDGIHYPGGAAQGVCGVVGGLLGYLQTFPDVPPGPVELRLCIYPKPPGNPSCCTTTFDLQRSLVWISGIEGIGVDTPPGVLDPNAQLVDGGGNVRSFGNVLRIFGTAWLGGCEERKIKQVRLAYHEGFVIDPTLPGFVPFWQIDFDKNAFQDAYRQTNPLFEDALTSRWRRFRICFPICHTVSNYLQDSRWNTRNPVLHHVEPVDPPTTPSPATWTSTPLPLPNCQSGRYTLRVTAEDESGNIYHDLQQVWFDNKPIGPSHAKISQISGVKPCDVVNLSQFAIGGDCDVAWPAQLLGIAYDEYIEEGNFAAPSDNFGGYRLWIKKDGAPGLGSTIPIPGPGGPAVGSNRVGTPDPADRCPNPVPPAGILPPETDGILTVLDLRRFDAICNPAEPGLTLDRGECCDYVITLEVWDDSICPGLSGGHHERTHTFPVRICNNLPKPPAP